MGYPDTLPSPREWALEPQRAGGVLWRKCSSAAPRHHVYPAQTPSPPLPPLLLSLPLPPPSPPLATPRCLREPPLFRRRRVRDPATQGFSKREAADGVETPGCRRDPERQGSARESRGAGARAWGGRGPGWRGLQSSELGLLLPGPSFPAGLPKWGRSPGGRPRQ